MLIRISNGLLTEVYTGTASPLPLPPIGCWLTSGHRPTWLQGCPNSWKALIYTAGWG